MPCESLDRKPEHQLEEQLQACQVRSALLTYQNSRDYDAPNSHWQHFGLDWVLHVSVLHTNRNFWVH